MSSVLLARFCASAGAASDTNASRHTKVVRITNLLKFRSILLHILDDEEFLTRPNQAEFAAGNLFDRLWILTKLTRPVAKLRVLGSCPRQGGFERRVLLPCLEHGEEPAVAHQRVD